MRANDFLMMMVQDNETRTSQKALYFEVIDCMEIALSQSPIDIEIDASKNIEDAFKLIREESRKPGNDNCCGPFKAAEVLAKYLGVNYCRASKKFANASTKVPTVNLDDFLD